MWILFLIISCILAAALGRKQAQYKTLQKEIAYISGQLQRLSECSERGFVILPTEHVCIQKLGAVLNILLQNFYVRKTEYEKKKRTMSQVLTNISHDIRTPLTVLKGNSELLAARAGDGSVPRSICDMAVRIDQKADHLITMINDYFTMSKITSGDFQLTWKRENLSGICRDIILDYYDLLEKEKFKVDIQIPDEQIFVYTDRDALQRILKNLIDNALHHGKDGEYLSLKLYKVREGYRIEVEDHGKGISAGEQKRIFTRTYTTAGSSGSGLGLSIAKHLAEQIGAQLSVQSIPDMKTVFCIVIKSEENVRFQKEKGQICFV